MTDNIIDIQDRLIGTVDILSIPEMTETQHAITVPIDYEQAIFDTGVVYSCSPIDRSYFTNYHACHTHIGSANSFSKVIGIGNLNMYCLDSSGNVHVITFTDVLHISNFRCTLISGDQIFQVKCTLYFCQIT